MKQVPVEMEVIDAETGEVTERKTVGFGLLPPPASACQVCARDPAHAPEQPHDVQSLYYQYAFYGEHGRWPTWKDALAHCAPEVQAKWEYALKEMGKWSEPEPSELPQ